jgi:prevent-host-death family protein
MEVGIRELRDRLSECIERAAKGEAITVTDGGLPRAMIGPIPERARLEQGVADGWLTLGSAEPFSPVRRAKARESVRAALDQDRGD